MAYDNKKEVVTINLDVSELDLIVDTLFAHKMILKAGSRAEEDSGRVNDIEALLARLERND